MDVNQQGVLILVLVVVSTFTLLVVVCFAMFMRPWIRAFLHGTPVPLVRIVAIRLRGNPPALLIDAYIGLMRGGTSVTITEVETAYIDARNRVSTSEDLVELVKRRTDSR